MKGSFLINTMRNFYFFSAFFFCFQDCGSCDKSTTNCLVTYRIEVPIDITPLKDTIELGDTLWINSIIPNELEDLNSGDQISVFDYDFKLFSKINRMDTLGAPDAEYDFNWISEIGSHNVLPSGPYFVSAYSYENEQSLKELSIGMECKKNGLYKIAFYYLTENLTDVQLTDSECLQNIDLYNVLDEGEDNNYYLLANNPNPIASQEEFKKYAIYAFMVVE